MVVAIIQLMENKSIIAIVIIVALVSTIHSEIALGSEVNMTLVEQSTGQINEIVNNMFLLSVEKSQEYSGLGQ